MLAELGEHHKWESVTFFCLKTPLHKDQTKDAVDFLTLRYLRRDAHESTSTLGRLGEWLLRESHTEGGFFRS